MKKFKERKKAIGFTMVFLLIMMSVLTGCSGTKTVGDGVSKEPSATDQPQSDGASKAPSATDTPQTDIDKSSFKGELTVLTPWGLGLKKQFELMFADFSKEYPNLKVKLLEQTTADLPALIAAGKTPDIVSSNGMAYDLRKDNLIEDLTPYIEIDPLVKPGVFLEPAYTRSVTPDGKVWALPWEVDPNFALSYSDDILQQYGFTEFPVINTLTEMGDFLKNFWVVKSGGQVMTTFLPNEIYGPMNTLVTWSYANGADADTFYNWDTGKVGFNDPKIVEALEWIVKFKRENIDDKRLAKMDATLPKDTGRFLAGKSLMQPDITPNLRQSYEKNPAVKFTLMPEKSLWLGGWSFSLATGGKKENKKAAWELLKWMTATKKGAESNQKNFGWVSGIKDNPYLEEQANTDPVMKIALETMQKTTKNPPQYPVSPDADFDKGWNDVMAGKLEPKAFLDHMTQLTETLIKEQK
jgi:multiple sugar transport system substrate-binding protein